MVTNLLRPSSAEKWVNCPASAKLEERYPDIQTDKALEGVFAHKIAEWCLKNNTSTLHAPYEIEIKGMVECVDSYVNYVRYISKDKELHVEYDVSLRPFGINRFGKIDSLCVSPNEIHVIDFKYGKWPVEIINNYQLLMYAYGVFNSNVKSIKLTIFQPRIKNKVSSWNLNVKEFKDRVQLIKDAIVKVNSNNPSFNPGKHCIFCKAKYNCPAKPRGVEFKSKPKFEDESYG